MLISAVSPQVNRFSQAKARPQAEVQFSGAAKTVATKVGMAAGAGFAAKLVLAAALGFVPFFSWGKAYAAEGGALAAAAGAGMLIQKYGGKKDEKSDVSEEK